MSGVTHHTPTAQSNNPAYDVSATAWDEAHDVGDLSVAGQMALAGIISPDQITGNVNDYNPTGLSAATVIRLTSDAPILIYGLAGGTNGREILLVNVGAFVIYLAFDDGFNSSAANRFCDVGPGGPGGFYVIEVGAGVRIWYDATSSRWRLISYPTWVYADEINLFSAGNAVIQAAQFLFMPGFNTPDAGAQLMGDSDGMTAFNAITQSQTQPSFDTTIFPNCSAVIEGLPFVVPIGAVLDIREWAVLSIRK